VIGVTEVDVRASYRECERITREQARNFSWGIRLLSPDKRGALSAVYAMARRIDDIGDGTLPDEEKLHLLAEARLVATEPQRYSEDPVATALADATRRLPIQLSAFGDLVDGCEMDVRGRHYDTFEELLEYCRCVAGSIGRLSLGVFGAPSGGRAGDRALRYADALGVALQLTNILRDIREDYGTGRIYLPQADLDLFGCKIDTLPDGTLDPQGGALAEVIRFEAARAWGWYDQGLQLLPMLDRRSAACCSAMAGIYHELLRRIAADPQAVMLGRMSLPARDKIRIATRALAARRADGRRVSRG
jgi:phytoene synthase